ncbi:hypothetical protein [Pseudomonas sp. EA_35y_Pfl2_R5]|uniref:hypothetical protein n=1 Tax=Pseudomonas sp. EA_35y_Pfl2_R5 TaxID=3088690 RepID=UPI0030D94A9C
MKDFLLALKDNLSNVFSIVGIGLTVYFAVFYVPNYVEELEIKKIEGTHASLVESIQELVYNNHSIDSGDIKTLIRGKELAGNMTYPFTPEELLIQVQESFLENKFIPLDQRKALIEKIDDIREELPSQPIENPKQDDKPFYGDVLSWVSAAFGIIAAIFGFNSIWSRNLKLEEIKIESTIEGRQESLKKKLQANMFLERDIYEIFKKVLGSNNVEHCPPSMPVDFIIKTANGRDTAIEVKYTEMEIIPLRVVNNLISAALKLKMPVLLISNANPTASAKKMLADFNSENKDLPIRYMNIYESKNIESDIKELFGITA